LRRTRLAVFVGTPVSVSEALMGVPVAAVVSVAVVELVTVAMVSPAGMLVPETTAPTSALVNPPPVQVRSMSSKKGKPV
jgi:hypothetical protein